MTVRNDWVGHLRRYSLKELRRRQNITRQQIRIAYKAKKTTALTELHNMADSLAEAVYLNEFA
jgi:ribosomal protein L19E